jgi:putative tryptophan/tyrosine transport system substrate-binding protein
MPDDDSLGNLPMMNRRAFITAVGLGALAAPSTAEAQPAAKVYRIGHLSSLAGPTVTPGAARADADAAFREKLHELGWVEGKSLTIENRYAGRDLERLAVFAVEFAHLPVDLIFTTGGVESAQAAKNATKTVPIVFATAGDPVMAGLVSGLSRPEANVTGLSSINTELDAKRLALLREALPRLRRVGVLQSPIDPSGAAQLRASEAAARSLGVQLQILPVRGLQDLSDAISAAKKQGAGAMMVLGSATLYEYQGRVAELVTKARLPSISAWRQLPEAGGLMSYGADIPEMFRRAAVYVDKILKGAKPADLPVEQPTKFELVINRKTARALGLTIPPSLLLRADAVIE